jgi:hypothetical protein
VRDAYVNRALLALGLTTDSAPRRMPVPALYGTKLLNPNEFGKPVPLTDQYIGPVYPPRIIGLGSTLSFKNGLTLDAQAEYQGGAYIVNFIGYQNALRNVWYPCYDTQKKLLLASVGPDGKANTGDEQASAIADVNALDRARCAIDRTVANSDYWAAKTDFVKLRSVSLSYIIPSRFVRGAKSATLVVAGRNLWKWTNYDGADSEANDASDAGTGLGRREYYQLPPYKSVLVSVRTTF